MRKLLLILSIFFITNSLSPTVFAQEKGAPQRRNWEKIDGIRLEFILKKLSLSSNTQEKFTPIYKTYQKEIRSLYSQRRAHREQNRNNPEAQVDRDFYFESRILETRKQYKNKFQEILTPEQLKAMYVAEREFKEQLLKQLKNNN